jgi:hypothetical protein
MRGVVDRSDAGAPAAGPWDERSWQIPRVPPGPRCLLAPTRAALAVHVAQDGQRSLAATGLTISLMLAAARAASGQFGRLPFSSMTRRQMLTIGESSDP